MYSGEFVMQYSQLRLIRNPQNSDFLYELTKVPNEEDILT